MTYTEPREPSAAKATAVVVVPADHSNKTAMPEFPWPPPKPLEQARVPKDLLKRDARSKLGDLDGQLQRALRGAGYSSNRYFGIPGDGFAIATRLERYEKNGQSSPGGDRWVVSDSSVSSFSLRTFLRALFTGETGQYRLFVIVVSDVPFGADPNKTLGPTEANQLMQEGWNRLPSSIASLPWTDDIDVHALVYEFEKREGRDPWARKPKTPGDIHLRDSKILEHLKPKP